MKLYSLCGQIKSCFVKYINTNPFCCVICLWEVGEIKIDLCCPFMGGWGDANQLVCLWEVRVIKIHLYVYGRLGRY